MAYELLGQVHLSVDGIFILVEKPEALKPRALG